MVGVRAHSDVVLSARKVVSCLHAGADAFMLEALFRNEAWGFMLQPVSQENEKAVCQSMVDGCRCESSHVGLCIDTEDGACARVGSSVQKPANVVVRLATQASAGGVSHHHRRRPGPAG